MSHTSDGSHFTSNGSFDGMAGTSETLPCGTVRDGSRSTVELGSTAARTVRWTLNTNENERDVGSDIVLRFSGGGSNTNTVRVDLASPEDISLGTDSSRAVYSATFGSNV